MNAETAHRTRREFFSGTKGTSQQVRPVGALNPRDFQSTCTQCGDCARACSEKIIRRGPDGFPTIDFTKGACTFCNACTEACETGALNADIAWPYQAKVSQDCLAHSAVQCRLCEDHCEERAIRFKLAAGGRATPDIDLEGCTGCGACLGSCPVQAITIQAINATTEVHA